ncbi:MAG: two-component regulator propeller domain-containing protein [Rudaea sp.]
MAWAAGAAPGVVNVRFRTYSTGDGLSQATALAMAQDGAGFLWIGTQDGLNRFDGNEFKIYRHVRGQPWSLSDSAVYALVTDKDGSLWIGTQAGGLNHYDPKLDRFVHFGTDPLSADVLASEHVTALMVDNRGWLWVASASGKLQWLDRVTSRFLDTPLGMQPALVNVRALLQASDGSVLIGSRDGLWRCDIDATYMHELRFDPTRPLDVQALAKGPDGDLWVATTASGLYRFSVAGKPLAWYHHSADASHALPGDEIRGLAFDHEGRLWVGTKASGLLLLTATDDGFAQFDHDPADPQSLSGDRQQTVFVDRGGLIWAGSWNNGVSLHDPRTEAFTTLQSAPGNAQALPRSPIVAALANPDGTLWFGMPSGGGMVRFDLKAGVVERFASDAGKPAGLPVALIERITRARDGSLWIATAGGGLVRLAPAASQFVRYRHATNDPGSLASDDLLDVTQDRAGTLWIGTADSGLDELCAGCTKFRHHQHDPSNPDSIGLGPVASVLEDTQGSLWVALRPGGLDRYNRSSGHFEHFRADPRDSQSLSNDTVTTFLLDSAGQIWVGTQGGGINHLLPGSYDKPRFEPISTTEGLAADAIGSIVEDDRHRLWIATTAGISRYDPATRVIVNFGPRDGALAQGYYINVMARLPEGRIVFGGPSGATVFNPDAVRLPPAPQPVLTSVWLNHHPLALRWQDPQSPLLTAPWTGGSAVFAHSQSYLGFDFTALGFADPQSVEYSYLLEGHDPKWIDTDASRRFAMYTDLPTGDYRLRVRARRPGYAWNTQEAQLQIRVLPAPWASPLSILGYCLVLMVVIGFGGWRTRESWLRQERARAAIQASAERLKYALWGSSGELWDVNLRDGTFVRENRLPHLRANVESRAQTIEDFQPFVHANDLPAFLRALKAHLKGENAFLEISYRSPSVTGGWLWLLTRGRVVERGADQRALRMVGTTQDITTLKHAEESLRKLNDELESRVDARTADLRRANTELRQTLEQLTVAQRHLLESEKMAALGGLVAGIAHEINTPLGVTVTAASHLREEAMRMARKSDPAGFDPEELARFHVAVGETSEIILRNLQRADQLIKSFKLVAVDQTTEERRRIELGGYLKEILISLGPTLKKTSHAVSIVCPEPVIIDTYPGALYQIVSNLLMNTLHHAFDPNQSGSITISARLSGTVAELSYRDNGRGMEEAVRARIFEPFFTTRRGQGGSGLGLHVVYNLVTQLLKGSIRVESAPGAGVLFEMFLPLDAERRVSTPER